MDGELTFAIPFLGLLVSDALEKTPREQKVVRRSTGRLKSKKQKSQDLEYQAGVNVCSLDLSPDLLKAQVARDDVQCNVSQGHSKRKSPTLHFVRGHTFVRNGKISYRVPHWRGVASSAPTVTKVKA